MTAPKSKQWTCEQWNASAREFQPVFSGTKAACENTAINIRDKGGIAKVVRTKSNPAKDRTVKSAAQQATIDAQHDIAEKKYRAMEQKAADIDEADEWIAAYAKVRKWTIRDAFKAWKEYKIQTRNDPPINAAEFQKLYRMKFGRVRTNPAKDKTVIPARIAKLKREGYPQAQAVAIAMREAQKPGSRTPPARRRNYSYPDIASIKNVLGAPYVHRLVNANFPRLAINNAHRKFAAANQWDKAEAVTALERYFAKADQKNVRRHNGAQSDYDKGLEVFGRASRRFNEIRAAHRRGDISDAAFARAQAVFDRADAAFDKLDAGLQRRNGAVVYKEYKGFKILTHGGRGFSSPAAGVKQLATVRDVERAIDKKKNPVKVLRTKPVAVRDTVTGERGQALTRLHGGWVKVKWDNRDRASLIKEDQLARENPFGTELAAGFIFPVAADAAKRISSRTQKMFNPRKNAVKAPSTSTSSDVRSPTKTSTSTYARTAGNITVTGGAGAGATTKVVVRRNPTVREQSEMFQGKANGKVETLKAASNAPADLARVGKLAGLKLTNRRAELKIPGAMVALDTRGKLWIVGNRAPLFNVKAKPGEGLDYGEIEKIAYVTAKAHVGSNKTFEYVHEFGEDGGKRPHLIIDPDGMPIIRGGDYTVKAAGIIN